MTVVDLHGARSREFLRRLLANGIDKLKVSGKALYSCMLNEQGKFTDDCILYRTGPNSWMVVHGSGTGHEELQRAAMGRDVSLRFDDNLHDLSLHDKYSRPWLPHASA